MDLNKEVSNNEEQESMGNVISENSDQNENTLEHAYVNEDSEIKVSPNIGNSDPTSGSEPVVASDIEDVNEDADIEITPTLENSTATNGLAPEPVATAETPAANRYEEDLRGLNPADVIRRRAMPGSPELRQYIERLNEYNHQAFAMNMAHVHQMRYQSEMELNSFIDFMHREETLRQARLEAVTMLSVFYIPPIWKRVVAELIDFFILLFIKLIVTFFIMDTFNIDTNMSRMHITQWLESPEIAAKMSTEIALLEIPFRIIVIIYETFFSMKFAGTPGKRWMGLRVLYVRELSIMDGDVLRRVATLRPRTCVRINPASILPFRFALMRAMLKNAFVGLLMSPVCFSFIFVNQNRTGYDVMTNSMVVEFKPNTNQEGPIWN